MSQISFGVLNKSDVPEELEDLALMTRSQSRSSFTSIGLGDTISPPLSPLPLSPSLSQGVRALNDTIFTVASPMLNQDDIPTFPNENGARSTRNVLQHHTPSRTPPSKKKANSVGFALPSTPVNKESKTIPKTPYPAESEVPRLDEDADAEGEFVINTQAPINDLETELFGI